MTMKEQTPISMELALYAQVREAPLFIYVSMVYKKEKVSMRASVLKENK